MSLQPVKRSCRCANAVLRTRLSTPRPKHWLTSNSFYRTRKIKEVDFGFSFGLDPPGSAFGDPSHASQPIGIVPEPPPPSNSAPASGLSVSPSQKSLERSGSARGGPQRRSIFDIPLDEPAEERRGSKRRKLGMFTDI